MKPKLLIVDDDRMTIMINEIIIARSQFNAIPQAFFNGKEALGYLLENDSIDNVYCIFLDINMPVMNGWEFLDAINTTEITSRIIVVMVSSSVNTADKKKAKSYPQVIDFLEKPINADVLNKLIKHKGLHDNFYLLT